MLRVISEVRPDWVVGENVPGIINMALEQVCADLEGLGYEVWPVIIPACAKNAPHKRNRVWIIAHNNKFNGNDGGLCSGQISQLEQTEIQQFYASPDNADTGYEGLCKSEKPTIEHELASHTEKPGLEGRNTTRPGGPAGCDSEHTDGFIRDDKTEPWNESWYEAASRLCTLDDGVSGGLVRPRGWRTNALKAAGNAIVPQIAYELFKAINQINIK